MPLGKLIKVVREVAVYKKTKGNTYSEEVAEINVDLIPLELLKSIVTPKDDDPLLYDGYILSHDQLDKLNAVMEIVVKPDCKKYDYVLVCSGIYENSNPNSNISN